DSRSIPAGVDFVEELLGRLRACSGVGGGIGPRWLTLTDDAGRRRIGDPGGWIRRGGAGALAAGGAGGPGLARAPGPPAGGGAAGGHRGVEPAAVPAAAAPADHGRLGVPGGADPRDGSGTGQGRRLARVGRRADTAAVARRGRAFRRPGG